jgi:hypothetical protein
MSERIVIELTEEDLRELGKLIQDTLIKLASIIKRHIEDTGIEDDNLWRSFLDELLMMYVSGLFKTHIRLLEITVDELCKMRKESDTI